VIASLHALRHVRIAIATGLLQLTADVSRFQSEKARNPCRRNAVPGDKAPINGDNPANRVVVRSRLESFVWEIVRNRIAQIRTADCRGTGCVARTLRSHAQWWSTPRLSISRCADLARRRRPRSAGLGTRRSNAKFGRRASRRRYTIFFRLMQDRSFDIAGPTRRRKTEAHRQQYTVFLDKQRRVTSRRLSRQSRSSQARATEQQPCGLKGIPAGGCGAPVKQRLGGRSQGARESEMRQQSTFSCEWRCFFRENHNFEESVVCFFPSPKPNAADLHHGESAPGAQRSPLTGSLELKSQRSSRAHSSALIRITSPELAVSDFGLFTSDATRRDAAIRRFSRGR